MVDLLFDQFKNTLNVWCTEFYAAQRHIDKPVIQVVNHTVIPFKCSLIKLVSNIADLFYSV